MEIVKVNEVLEAIEDIRRKKELESSIAYGHGFYAGVATVERLIKEKACTVDKFANRGHWIDAYPAIEPNPMYAYAMCSECGCEQIALCNKINLPQKDHLAMAALALSMENLKLKQSRSLGEDIDRLGELENTIDEYLDEL